MKAEVYYAVSTFIQLAIAVGAIVFGRWQIKINRRLKELQDYVAISIVPRNDLPGIEIRNVGKINLYLRKADLGDNITHNYYNPRLIPAGRDPFYLIGFPPNLFPPNRTAGQEISIKLYFLDELNEKYLAEGAAVIDIIQIPTPPQAPTEQRIEDQSVQQQAPTHISGLKVRAWSYKTIKHKWEL